MLNFMASKKGSITNFPPFSFLSLLDPGFGIRDPGSGINTFRINIGCVSIFSCKDYVEAIYLATGTL
jgi:hypothetical protein